MTDPIDRMPVRPGRAPRPPYRWTEENPLAAATGIFNAMLIMAGLVALGWLVIKLLRMVYA